MRYWNTHPISTESVPHPKGTREFFEAIYAAWSKGIDPVRLEFLDSCREKKVLEIGCGIGKDARFLTENGIAYTGIDFSSRTLEHASRHFSFCRLPARFANADATALPFADESFDLVMAIGVLHHVPEIEAACTEALRVLRPGGTLRVMLYNRCSYHYALVRYGVCPLLWLALRFPFLQPLLMFGPQKLQKLLEISKCHGYSVGRILAASADTSAAGVDNFTPVTYFFSKNDFYRLFPGLEGRQFLRQDMKYFPLPFLASTAERWLGFFLTMVARKPGHKTR